MNFDVWKYVVVFGLIPVLTGFPRGHHSRKDPGHFNIQSVAKRVEIPDKPYGDKQENPLRRQSVIHAGVDYSVKEIVDETAADEFENLGKMTDFSGKVVKSITPKVKKDETKYKDSQPTTKDIIEKMKELQDNLFRRGGSKELAAKLKLMEPEIASAAKALQSSPAPKAMVNNSLPGKDLSKQTFTLPKQAPAQPLLPTQLLAGVKQPALALLNNSSFLQSPIPILMIAQNSESKSLQQGLPQIIKVPQLTVSESPPSFIQSLQNNSNTPTQQKTVSSLPSVSQQSLTNNVALPIPQTSQLTPNIPNENKNAYSQGSLQKQVSKPSTENEMNKAPLSTEKAESRKIIPEDVVNKIIEKFQELKTEAQNFAILEKDKPVHASTPKKESYEEVHGHGKTESSSPYATIGPAKDNDEFKNLTSNSNSLNSGTLQDSQVIQAPNIGPVVPAAPQPPQPMSMTTVSSPQTLPTQPEYSGEKTSTSTGAMQNNIPMMFIKTGQVLVPIFGNQNQGQASPQNGANSNLSPPQESLAPLLPAPTPQQDAPPQIPPQPTPSESMAFPQPGSTGPQSFNQQEPPPIMPVGLSDSRQMTLPSNSNIFPQFQYHSEDNQSNSPTFSMPPQSTDQSSVSRCCITGPNIPPAMSQMSPPFPSPVNQMPFLPPAMRQPGPPGVVNTAMLNNLPALPAVPPQMMGGVVNALPQSLIPPPQDASRNMYPHNTFQSQGYASNFPSSIISQYSRGAHNNPSRSSYMSESSFLGPSAIGTSFMKSGGMNMPENSQPDVEQWTNNHNEMASNFAVMQKEKELEQAALNDISDPAQGNSPMGNVSPDQLLDIADARSNLESINPDSSTRRAPGKVNPDALLDKVQDEELKIGLAGPGDPSKDISRFKGINPPEPSNPYTGTTPDDLLDMLSSKKKGSFSDYNRNLFSMPSNILHNQQHQLPYESSGTRKDSQYPTPYQSPQHNEYQMQTLGTSGMQSVVAMPSGGKQEGFDPSVADIVEPKTSERNPSDLLSQYISRHRVSKSNEVNPLEKSVSVMSDDVLQFEHSRKAIDSDDVISKYNQEQSETRHKITKPGYHLRGNRDIPKPVRKTTIATNTLEKDKVELRVNGFKLIDNEHLHSKLKNGSIVSPKGKTLTTKGPVRVELSHADDVTNTKVVNIITSSEFNITDSRRNKIHKP